MGKIVRCISKDGSVFATAVDATDLAARAEQIHKTSAVVTAALGRLLSAASMMGYLLKGKEDSVTLRVKGDGPVGTVIAAADSSGNVRGYVGNPVVELPLNEKGKLDVGGAVGKNGALYVMKDLGLKEPYIGSVPLISGELAEEVTSYYAASEQIPTVCSLGVLVNPDLTVRAAGGFLVQLLPFAPEETIEKVEQAIAAIPPVTKLLDGGVTPEDICRRALAGFEVDLLDEALVEYRCDCSREKILRALASLGEDELREMAEEKETEVTCHFCDAVYRFSGDELRALIKK